MPISKAVQASTALPGLYRPVRIDGRDYVDGGVKKTAHINLAIRHGAGLVICINPIVPFLNDTANGPLDGHLSNSGVTYVLDQVMRIMLHGRMQYGMERYESEHPEVDILLIEPTRDDMRMFGYNIMRTSARRVVAEHGYRSALAFFQAQRRAPPAACSRSTGSRCATRAGRPTSRCPRSRRSRLARTLDGRARPARGAARRAPLLAEPDRAAARQAAVDHALDRLRAPARRAVDQDRVLGGLGPVLADGRSARRSRSTTWSAAARSPSGPSSGKVGVIGKYGRPNGRPTQSAFASTGWISSAPTTAHGMIGAPVRSARRTKPPRPKRASL